MQGTRAQIAVSSYYAAKQRPPSARSVRDEQLLPKLRAVYEENYSCYGVRKMWHAMNNQHGDQFGTIARCTVERLMKITGIDGVWRKRKKPTTRSADPESCPVDLVDLVDLVDRQFTVAAPNRLWVADITYVPTHAGWVYAMFILDVFSREIVGWQVTNHMRESLARDALMMALARKYRDGEDVTGLVHHSDRGVQGEFYRSSQHPNHGGVQQWRQGTGVGRPVTFRRVCGGSGAQIVRFDRQCVLRGGRIPLGWCSASSGGRSRRVLRQRKRR